MTLAVYATALAAEGYSVEAARSLALVFMTTQQLVLVVCTRSLTRSLVHTGVLGNRWLLGAVALSTVLLCAGDYIPGVNSFLNLTPLAAADWGQVALGAVAIVVANELLKALLRAPWPACWRRARAPLADAVHALLPASPSAASLASEATASTAAS